MRNRVLPVVLATMMSFPACSDDSSPSQPADGDSGVDALPAEAGTDAHEEAAAPLGTVILRFLNTGTKEIYVDYSFDRPPMAISDVHGEKLSLTSACTMACPCSDACIQCGAPRPTVKVIGPGQHVDGTWNGTYYTFQSCPGSSCQCSENHQSPPGSFVASLAGALGVSGGTPDATEAFLLLDASIDTTEGACSAASSFELDASEHIVEIPFVCSIP